MPSFRSRRLLLVLLALPVLFLFLLYINSSGTVSDLFSTDARPSKLPDEIFGLLHFVISPDEAGRVINAAGDGARGVALDNDPAVQLEDAVAPDKPVAMGWYALGSIAKAGGRGGSESESVSRGWEERLRALQEYPLVVFSKVRPSLRASRLRSARTLTDSTRSIRRRIARELFPGRCLALELSSRFVPASFMLCRYSRRAKRLLETYDLSPPPKIIEVDLRGTAVGFRPGFC